MWKSGKLWKSGKMWKNADYPRALCFGGSLHFVLTFAANCAILDMAIYIQFSSPVNMVSQPS